MIMLSRSHVHFLNDKFTGIYKKAYKTAENNVNFHKNGNFSDF